MPDGPPHSLCPIGRRRAAHAAMPRGGDDHAGLDGDPQRWEGGPAPRRCCGQEAVLLTSYSVVIQVKSLLWMLLLPSLHCWSSVLDDGDMCWMRHDIGLSGWTRT